MIEALSYEYDLLTDVSWPRLLLVAASLAGAWWAEGRVGWRFVTAAWFLSQGVEAALLGFHSGGSLNVAIWWAIFAIVPYVAVRPELRRMVVAAPRQATMLLPHLVEWVRSRRTPPTEGALKNREALKLLRAEGWRPGWTRQTVSDASGQEHTVWAPPQRLPLGMRMHGWLAFLPTVVLGGAALWLFLQLPWWAKPIAEAGIGVGILGHLGLLPHPLRLIGL